VNKTQTQGASSNVSIAKGHQTPEPAVWP